MRIQKHKKKKFLNTVITGKIAVISALFGNFFLTKITVWTPLLVKVIFPKIVLGAIIAGTHLISIIPSFNFAQDGFRSTTQSTTRNSSTSGGGISESRGCASPKACNYSSSANADDGSCFFCDVNEICASGNSCCSDLNGDGICDKPTAPVRGCTDPNACNYDPNATADNGNCVTCSPGNICSDETTCCSDPDNNGICGDQRVPGCMRKKACNYDANATTDDGSCVICTIGLICNEDDTGCCSDPDGNGTCGDQSIPGCTNSNACNYNPSATVDDGSCFLCGNGQICNGSQSCCNDPDNNDVCGDQRIRGCTDIDACNYNSAATHDDGSCIAPAGCDQSRCPGDPGSPTVVDQCGVCGGNNSSCDDCAGIPNGPNTVDQCGVCDDISSNNNTTCTDCAGIPNGSHQVDNCGNCKDINDPTFGQGCNDCAGIPDGPNTLDACGVCDSDPRNDNSTCTDCAGIPNGPNTLDACGVCDSDPRNDNSTCTDCAGIPNGNNTLDACGVCDDNPNNDNITCADCNGIVNGPNTLDACGVCDDNPNNDNTTCIDCNGNLGGSAVIDSCGSCKEPTDPTFGLGCQDCAGIPHGLSVIDQCSQCLLPNDPNFNNCIDCNGTPFGGAQQDLCGACLAPGDPQFNSCLDCAGVPNGSNMLDACNVCDANPNNDNTTCADCAGIPNGNNYVDACGVCNSNPLDDNRSCTDCSGTLYGTFRYDSCGECLDPNDPNFGQGCIDCAGIPNGDNYVDACGICNDNPDDDNTSCIDCAGVPNGDSYVDGCDICDANPNNDNTTCADCAGKINGAYEVDSCGACLDPNDPAFGQGCIDCAGVYNGQSYVDACGVCDSNANNDNTTCTDCAGIPNGSNTLDQCGVCDSNPNNDNTTCADCAGIPNGSNTLDQCGVCDSNSNNNNTTCLDCAGNINGNDILDSCDVCLDPNDPDFGKGCIDCSGTQDGNHIIDACGSCVAPTDTEYNACLDCAGDPFGNNVPGSTCNDGNAMTINDTRTSSCSCKGTLHVIQTNSLPYTIDPSVVSSPSYTTNITESNNITTSPSSSALGSSQVTTTHIIAPSTSNKKEVIFTEYTVDSFGKTITSTKKTPSVTPVSTNTQTYITIYVTKGNVSQVQGCLAQTDQKGCITQLASETIFLDDNMCVDLIIEGYISNENTFEVTYVGPGMCKRYVPGAIYATFDDDKVGSNQLKSIAQRFDIDNISQPFLTLGIKTFRVEFDPKIPQRTVLNHILDTFGDNVVEEYSELIPLFETVSLIPDYLPTIGYNDFVQQCQHLLTPTAYEQNRHSVRVAVVDNAFQADHEDLADNVWQTYDVAHQDEDVSPPELTDDWMHGNIDAGLVGAVSNNDLGIVSVSNDTVQLILVKATSDTMSPHDIDYGIEALSKAAEYNPNIISISRGVSFESRVLERVITKILKRNITVVAAAGNFSTSLPFYPAAYDEVISVAAVRDNKKRASFSNYGTWVDIAAPGVDMLSTALNNTYKEADGTSQSAPLVAGILAFIKAHGSQVDDIYNTVEKTNDPLIGAGIVSIANRCASACQVSYPDLDYNLDGKFDIDDLRALLMYRRDTIGTEACPDDDPESVCCPDGMLCDFNDDSKFNNADVNVLKGILAKTDYVDICGDGIDNNCDGVIDNGCDEQEHGIAFEIASYVPKLSYQALFSFGIILILIVLRVRRKEKQEEEENINT